jgi:hypothetical protein
MAKVEDKTKEVIPYFQKKLSGYRVDRGLTTFSDHARDVPVIGKSSYKDKARGSGEIASIDSVSGALQRIDAEVPGIPILWAADIIFTFDTRQTATEKGGLILGAHRSMTYGVV